MNEEFSKLLNRLETAEISPLQFQAMARTLDDFSSDLLFELNRRWESGEVRVITNLVWLVHLWPSPDFSAVLCLLLSKRPNSSYMEAIVDALHDIRNPESVNCLKAVIDYREVGDDDLGFSRKVLWALENIGGEDAHNAIYDAAKDENQVIRETAQQILNNWKGPK